MKKVFLIILIFIYLKGFSQYPANQFIGTDSALVTSRGALKSRLVNHVYTDTTQANTERISQYPGAMIFTSSDNKFWLRNALATAWIDVSGGGGGGDMVLASTQTNTGAKTFLNGTLLLRNVANTFNGVFTNTNTADRTYTLQNANGTLAFLSDITGINSGTNTGDVTLAGTPDYITIAGQVITRNQINLATHVTGRLPFANLAQFGANTVATNPTTGTADLSSTALATSQLLGRGSTGNIAAITLGTNLSMSGTTLNATGGSSNVESSVTHTSGQTLVLTSATNTVYVDPSLAIDTLTITLPDLGSIPTHLDSLYIDIYFGGTTASTNEVVGQIYIATTGGNLLFQESTPSIIYSGEHLRYKYKRSLEYWYRANNYSTRGENETIAKATIFKAFDYLAYDDTLSWDYVDGRNKTIILDSHAVLLDIAGAPNGAEGTLKVVQDGTGGKRLTLPGDTAAGWWFYGQPGSSQMYHWIKDEEGFKWFMPQFFPYRDTMEVEAAMFIKRIEVEGVVWHDTLKNYFNRFIKTLKDSGWYQDASEMWFMARGNRDAYRLGIKGYRDIDFFGDLWVMYDNGADCNCVAGTYANTNLVAADTLSLNDFSISYYSQANLGEGGQAGEVNVGAHIQTLETINLMTNISGDAIGDPGSSQQRIQVANADERGFYSLIRTSNVRADLYKNGTSIGNSTITNNGALTTIPFYLHAQNSGNTQVAGALARVSFLYFGKSRTASEEANFRTAVQTLHTGFGIAQ